MAGRTWTCLAFSAFLFFAWISVGKGVGPIREGPIWFERIYLTLQEAFGDKRTQWPELLIWNQENRGAMFVPGSNKIFIDQKLVTCCAKFGDRADDAMAFVI
ncbi:MAG: hypothetical protein HKN87_24425, partial [Saprospiraceae bacterium]|nr:hypothetical protein [Saprospiraceae bacterium]